MFNEEEFLRIANRPTVQFTGDEFKTKDSDKKRIIEYITQNELDYKISDNGIFKFHLISDDGYMFQIYDYNDQYVVTKSDKSRHFEYYYYKNLQQVLEQLAFYDNNLHKIWWEPIANAIDIGFYKEEYTDDWSKDFTTIDTNWTHIEEDQYRCAVYQKKTHIKVISPFNTLHEVSAFNTYKPDDMEKLYMEIHPISVKKGAESYLVKILINNEEIMKEYINYRVKRKKGLKLFLENLFNNKNQYIQFQ